MFLFSMVVVFCVIFGIGKKNPTWCSVGFQQKKTHLSSFWKLPPTDYCLPLLSLWNSIEAKSWDVWILTIIQAAPDHVLIHHNIRSGLNFYLFVQVCYLLLSPARVFCLDHKFINSFFSYLILQKLFSTKSVNHHMKVTSLFKETLRLCEINPATSCL